MDNTVGRLQSLFPLHQFDVIIRVIIRRCAIRMSLNGETTPRERKVANSSKREAERVRFMGLILENLIP